MVFHILVVFKKFSDKGQENNWSCGLHVYIGLEPWGQDILIPLLDASLLYQDLIKSLMHTTSHRLIFCPPVTLQMRQLFISESCADVLYHRGRPQSHRCGINLASWFDIGTVEFRYANGSLNYDEILNTVEFYLRFVAAIGSGHKLPCEPISMARELGSPRSGFPPATSIPRWFQERTWLENSFIPILTPLLNTFIPDGEIHHILPLPEGILVAMETSDGELCKYIVCPPSEGWKVVRQITE